MRCSKHHEELDANGIGKCSVPMWMGGLPAGFCDETAYGKQEPGQRRYGEYQKNWGGKWYDGYCSGNACYNHGGPKTRVFLDGNQWCAVRPDFVNLQESPAGFGDTPELARQELEAANAEVSDGV